MKIKFVVLSLISLASAVTAFYLFSNNPRKHIVLFSDSPESDGGEADARYKWELMRLADPATGKIPENVRARELAFAAKLPKFESSFNQRSSAATPVFNSRGPWNVGGRTRSVAVDVSNDSVIFSGSVNGGLYRSADRGNTWTFVSGRGEIPAISCLVQDQRIGHTNNWYYGTGEGYGTSASATGAFYTGNGIYKSTDGGLTWAPLPSTYSNTPQTVTPFDISWDLAMDYSDTMNDVVYDAALFYGIKMSKNGGTTWTTDLNTSAYFTDVKVSPTGIAYASASSDGSNKGMWRKQNSVWTKISPPDWDTTTFNRYVIGINPSNENEVYFLGNNTIYHGKETKDEYGDLEWNSLWKYTYLSGNGDSSGGQWQDLSQNLPGDTTVSSFRNFYTQGGYDIVVRVHPDSSNIVYIGGTNLYRSTDGFTSPNNTKVIGGYNPASTLPFYLLYPNHHPDQHNMVFVPSNHKVMIETNDGGIFTTLNDIADSVMWQSLNIGYVTGQFYTVATDHGSVPNDIIIGGLQDNGSWFTNSSTLNKPWAMPGAGDGSYCFIDDGHATYYMSRNQGTVAKLTVDSTGEVTAYRRIDPIDGLSKTDYIFVNPFVIDPNKNSAMFMSAGNHVWRNDSLDMIALNNQWDSISQGWFEFPDSVPTGLVVTALSMSKNPAGILYYGTSMRKIYRVANPYSSTPDTIDITGKAPNAFPSAGYMSCIAVDPTDANNVMIVFSNYGVNNLFYTTNGGTSWVRVIGNLLPAPTNGDDISMRWASIIPVSSGYVYLVGTSIGLFGTSVLDTMNTVWTQLSPDGIGNMVVDMIDYRSSDEQVAVATHGGGIYTANITDVLPAGVPNLQLPSLSVNVYPNPATTQAVISFALVNAENITIKVFDERGAIVETLMQGNMEAGAHQIVLDRKNIVSGIYFVNIKSADSINETRKVVFRN